MTLRKANSGKEFVKINQQAIARVDQSPVNPKRWSLTMADGHCFWVTSNQKPRAKTTICAVCAGKPRYQVRKDVILATVSDMMSNLLYYDRKEDANLGTGEIESMIMNDEISIDDILNVVREKLSEAVGKR